MINFSSVKSNEAKFLYMWKLFNPEARSVKLRHLTEAMAFIYFNLSIILNIECLSYYVMIFDLLKSSSLISA